MKNASLHQLAIYVSLAKTGNMTNTAQALHMTQSGVSQHLQLLEQASAIELFDRLPRKVVLTEAGAKLLPFANKVLDSMKLITNEAEIVSGQVGGKLRLAAVSGSKYFVPQALSQFLVNQKELVVPQLMLSNRDKVLEALMAMEVDVVIAGYPPKKTNQIESQPFAPNHLLLVAHPDFSKLLATQNTKAFKYNVKQLLPATWLIREKGSGTRDALERLWKKHQIKPKSVIEIDDIESIKQSVMANLGISLISQSAVKHELAEGRMISLCTIGLPVTRNWHLLTLKGRTLGATPRAFIDFVLRKGVDCL